MVKTYEHLIDQISLKFSSTRGWRGLYFLRFHNVRLSNIDHIYLDVNKSRHIYVIRFINMYMYVKVLHSELEGVIATTFLSQPARLMGINFSQNAWRPRVRMGEGCMHPCGAIRATCPILLVRKIPLVAVPPIMHGTVMDWAHHR